MKRITLLAVLVFAFASNAWAGGHAPKVTIKKITVNNVTNTTINNTTIEENLNNNDYGVKLDAPNLVRLSDTWTAGVEGGKVLNNTNGDEGWFVFGKITYSGTLLDLSKGKNK